MCAAGCEVVHSGNFRDGLPVEEGVRLPAPRRLSRLLGVGPVGVAVAVAALLAGCGGAEPGSAGTAVALTDNDYAGAVVDPGYPPPAATFTDTSGEPWTFAKDATRPVTLVFFGYTSCPDVCSAQLADLIAALRRVDPGVRQKVQVVWITVDPERDDPGTIRSYLDRFDPTIVGLTAPEEVIERAADHMGVALTGRSDLKSTYEVGHGAQIIGTTSTGMSVVWVPGTPVAELRSDISRLASTV